ncbi:MAG: UDP-N-acetylmuramate--L-alanine ligase [Spirochaetales bacterium]|nr:UDP-N-acetylmuramate--L-alanine ligase [Spirochaetales bacterium]
MITKDILNELTGKRVHMVGIKGTGMTAFVEILVSHGALVTGSDVPDTFYTDTILKELGVTVFTDFSEKHINASVDWVIYSSAYSPEQNPEIMKAIALKIMVSTYPEALGLFSRKQYSVAVAGVHGKTTTTAILGRLCQAVQLPATILVGSQVNDFNNRCTCVLGKDYFIAETCEYRANFLEFSPSIILLTSLEMDHPDFFTSLDHMKSVFKAYVLKLPDNGALVYCADDKNVEDLVRELKNEKPWIHYVPYGFGAENDFQIINSREKPGKIGFTLKGFEENFVLKIPGAHNVLNSAGAIAVMTLLIQHQNGRLNSKDVQALSFGLTDFHGTKRRSEILGERNGILFMDDYAHHPTAVKTTLLGIKKFYPQRRLIVDFMSHTYSRTEKLFNEFAHCLQAADGVILHPVYASAREKASNGINGKSLFDAVKNNRDEVYFFEKFEAAIVFLENYLQAGDIFVTMGAGDNWKIGYQLYFD